MWYYAYNGASALRLQQTNKEITIIPSNSTPSRSNGNGNNRSNGTNGRPGNGSRPGNSSRPGDNRGNGGPNRSNNTGAPRSNGNGPGRGPRPAGANGGGPRPNGGGPRNKSRGMKPARPDNSVKKKKEVEEDDSESAIEVEGVVITVLAGTMFKVRLQNGHEVLAHISGKMRKRFIKLVVGDKVRMEMSPYDLTKARIVFRLNQ